jgi:hypothetical protein
MTTEKSLVKRLLFKPSQFLEDVEGIYRVIPKICENCNRKSEQTLYCKNGLDQLQKKNSCVWFNMIRPRRV